MKKFFLFLLLPLFSACLADSFTDTTSIQINSPTFISAAEFRSSVKVLPPQPILIKGKTIVNNGYIYISDTRSGIHVYNIQQGRPQAIAYIKLIGNTDILIYNNTLYADCYTDLVWFDISNPTNIAIKGRIEYLFRALPPTGNDYGVDMASISNTLDIVTGWRVVTTIVEANKDGTTVKEYKPLRNGSSTSLALYQNYLYAGNHNFVQVFDIDKIKPTAQNKIPAPLQSVEVYDSLLVARNTFGSSLLFLDNPLEPSQQSSIDQIWLCNYMSIHNSVLFATTYSGNSCAQNFNELAIYSIKDIKNPQRITAYEMTSPKGAAVYNNLLFICDNGLKIYSTENVEMLNEQLLKHYPIKGDEIVYIDNSIIILKTQEKIYLYSHKILEYIELIGEIQ